MTNYIEISYFWLSGNWDSPKVIHLSWVGLLLICHIWPHVATHTIPGLLLASLATSWLGSITLGDTVTWGVGTPGTTYTLTQLITGCNLGVSFLNKAELGEFISSFGSFHSLHNAQPFSLNTLSETILLILKILCKVWSLVALIVYDQLWHISLCRPLFWLVPLHVLCTRPNCHRQRWWSGPGSLLPAW